MENYESKIIAFYDGDCGFCNFWVRFFNQRNNGNIYFASLQGTFAGNTLTGKNAQLRKELSSLIVKTENGMVLTKSNAALYLFKNIKSPYKIVYGLKIFPSFIRDFVYSIIARLRHSLFEKSYCYLPSENEKKFMISD